MRPANDRLDVTGVREQRPHDRVPAGRRVVTQGRLGEHERMVREQRTTERDLGRGPGRGVRLVHQPVRQRTHDDGFRRHPVAPGERDADQLQGQRPAGAGRGVGGHARGEILGHEQGPGRDQDPRTGAGEQTVGEHVVGERPIRIHAARHDLAHRIRHDDVDPLERGDDRLVRRGERRGIGRKPHVAATARARLVDEPAQDGERALGTRGDRQPGRVEGIEAAAGGRRGAPRLERRARARHPLGQLPARRDVHANELRTRLDREPGLVERIHDRR